MIVPTYNRPAELARLLGYLVAHRVEFPVLVLDSSTPEIQERNRACVAGSALQASVHAFDASVSPWEKFMRGAELAGTAYCSLCADDDVILPAAIDPILDFLDSHADFALGHGWYFTFYDNGHIGITASVYKGSSIDQPDALARLYSMFRNYEALTYGVYRTTVMRSVLSDVQRVQSMLGRELLGGALTLAHGKAARLPIFYYGRSHLPSHPYTHWHPLDFLISAPDEFYRDYAAYRVILLQRLLALGYTRYTRDETATLLDLIHFRYLADYVRPRVMDYLVERKLERVSKPEIMQGLWSVLARENDPSLFGLVSGSNALRKLRDRYFPRLKLSHLRHFVAPNETRTVHTTTRAGRAREYRFYREFLATIQPGNGLAEQVDSITAALDCYD